MKNRLARFAFLGALTLAAGGAFAADAPMRATAVLKPIGDSKVQGTVTFEQIDDAVRVEAAVNGLEPNSEHGFHVHENGSCDNNADAAGGHFAPQSHPHGPPGSGSHAGDLPMLKADATGKAALNFRASGLTLAHGANSAVGKAVIVHKGKDDFSSQPSGNSGPRIGCGVVSADAAAK